MSTHKQALDRSTTIYAVESRAAFAPIAERVELRRATAPFVDAFVTWTAATVAKLSAKSSLAGAFNHTFIGARHCRGSLRTDG